MACICNETFTELRSIVRLEVLDGLSLGFSPQCTTHVVFSIQRNLETLYVMRFKLIAAWFEYLRYGDGSAILWTNGDTLFVNDGKT